MNGLAGSQLTNSYNLKNSSNQIESVVTSNNNKTNNN